MSEEIREQINKVKNFSQFLNEDKSNHFDKDFKFKKEFKNAIVYSNIGIDFFNYEPEDDSSEIYTGTKIGSLDGDEAGIDTLIIITNDTEFYSPSGNLTDDSYVDLKLEDGKFIRFSEPIDLLVTRDWEQYIEDDPDLMDDIVSKYDLDHFLLEA